MYVHMFLSFSTTICQHVYDLCLYLRLPLCVDVRRLLSFFFKDRMAANSLATEKLHRSIQQLKEEKKVRGRIS